MSAEVAGDIGLVHNSNNNISNYKGVMLCNRPKGPGEANTHER